MKHWLFLSGVLDVQTNLMSAVENSLVEVKQDSTKLEVGRVQPVYDIYFMDKAYSSLQRTCS